MKPTSKVGLDSGSKETEEKVLSQVLKEYRRRSEQPLVAKAGLVGLSFLAVFLSSISFMLFPWTTLGVFTASSLAYLFTAGKPVEILPTEPSQACPTCANSSAPCESCSR